MAKRNPLVLLHRANTPAMFSQASDTYFNGVEVDLRMTKDGIVILRHDRRVQSADGRYHFIDALSYAELHSILGDDLIRFDQFISYIKHAVQSRASFILDLDLKQDGMAVEIVRILTGLPKKISVIVCSVDVAILRKISHAKSDAYLCLTLEPMKDRWDMWTSKTFQFIMVLIYFTLYPVIFRLIRRKTNTGDLHILRLFSRKPVKEDITYASIHRRIMSIKVAQFLQDAGLQILVYGISSAEQVAHMKMLGADGVKIQTKIT